MKEPTTLYMVINEAPKGALYGSYNLKNMSKKRYAELRRMMYDFIEEQDKNFNIV